MGNLLYQTTKPYKFRDKQKTGYTKDETKDSEGMKNLNELAKEYSDKNHNRCYKLVSWILLVIGLLVCLSAFLYVSVIQARQSYTQCDEKKTQNISLDQGQTTDLEVCIDCLRLVENPYTHLWEDPVLQRLEKRMEDDVMKCCAGNYTQMSALLTAVARGQATLKNALPGVYTTIDKSTHVFVHKQMVAESINSVAGYSVVKFDPNNIDAEREQSQGASILKDGIIILNAGMYYVYSHVFFNGNETGRKDPNQTWFSHVHRTSPQSSMKTGILLTSAHTRCFDCSVDKLSVFTGGVFQLYSGDVIRVFLSDIGLVHFNKISSYLGLFLA